MTDLMKKELGGELPEDAATECLEGAERTKKALKRKGPMEYRNYGKCVMAATSLEAVIECEG